MPSEQLLPNLANRAILLGTDLDLAANRAFPFAVALARRLNCRLLVVHALTQAWPSRDQPAGSLEGTARLQALQGEVHRLRDSDLLGSVACEVIGRSGEVWEAAADVVGDYDIGLMIVGTRALRGWKKLRFGSVAEDLLRSLDCPVMIVGPNVQAHPERFSRILYGSDFERSSSRALLYALTLAKADNATLTLLHVVRNAPNDEKLRARYRTELNALIPLESEFRARVEFGVEFGDPAELIVRESERQAADLIVLGARPAGKLATYLPSITHYTLQHARCPVLTVRRNV